MAITGTGSLSSLEPLSSCPLPDSPRKRSYPSNNRAKLPFEFSTSIEREGLKVRYGDGFGGAPLRLPWAPRRLTTGAETSSDEQTQEPSSTPVGGNDHV